MKYTLLTTHQKEEKLPWYKAAVYYNYEKNRVVATLLGLNIPIILILLLYNFIRRFHIIVGLY